MTTKEAAEAIAAIEYLRDRAGSGSSVTICCDNDDPPPNSAVDCCGAWTGWVETRFSGYDLLACLRAARTRKMEVEKSLQ